MKTQLFFFTGVLSVLLAGCDPDLVVTHLEATGPADVNSDNSVEVDVRVVVLNQGNAAAGVFKTSMEYSGPDGTFAVPFTVDEQSSIWHPRTDEPLASGTDREFEGKVTFHPSLHGITVSLVALADSCAGDEFMPDYCRVEESNEGNNASSAISLTLP